MTSGQAQKDLKPSAIDASCFDFSLLVGREVTLFSSQFPGKPLKSRVVLANNQEISLDRSGGSSLIDNLVSNQKITVRMGYKGQQLTIPATLKRGDGGKCRIVLGKKVVPLSRRRFTRAVITRPVKLAAVPISTFHRNKLGRLRWMETVTVDISGGGALIDFSNSLVSPTYLFLHIELEEVFFPSLVLGHVLYSLPRDKSNYHIGLEFIIREDREKHFPPSTLKQLPMVVFEFGKNERIELNKRIFAWKQNNHLQLNCGSLQ